MLAKSNQLLRVARLFADTMHRLNFIHCFLLLAASLLVTGCFPPSGGGGGGGTPGTPVNPTGELIKMVGFMLFFFLIMWVVMIRPQQKKQKAHDNLLKELKTGDRVVANGMLGTVVTVKGTTVTLRTGESKIEIMKHSVSEVLADEVKEV